MSKEQLNERSRAALDGAAAYATDLSHDRITPAHLLMAMLLDEDGEAVRALSELRVDLTRLQSGLQRALASLPKRGGRPSDSPSLTTLFENAWRQAKRERKRDIGPGHLLVAILDGSPDAARSALESVAVTRAGLRHALGTSELPLSDAQSRAPTTAASSAPKRKRKAKAPDDDDGRPMLERFGRDLTALARAGELDPIIGRDSEIRRVMQILGRRSKNNPVLVGEPGVGKTAVVEGFAYRLVGEDVPYNLRNKRLIELDLGAIVAGTTLRGQFEGRVKALVDEVRESNGQVILYIDEIHSLVGAGGGDSGGAANMLKPALARGEITVIGTTTPAEYRSHIESDKALERRFQSVDVEQPSVEESIAIVRGIKERYEIHHRVRITDAAVQAAVLLAERYVTDRKLPDKAIDLMDEAASRLRMEVDSQPAEIYELKRRVANIEVERATLLREDTDSARKTLATLDAEHASLKATLDRLEGRLNAEKAALDKVTELKAELEGTRKLVEQAQADADHGRVAELRYAVVPRLEDELKAQTAALDNLHDEGRMVREEVLESDIATVVGDWTGIPANKMLEGERQKILAVGERLGNRVIGQAEAVEAIAGAVRRSRAGVQDTDRPIGSFFFVGPTGVGKTELAKALADFLFDSEDALIRIDMSEYMEQSKVNSLIGSARGYVDSDKGGMLTEAVRRRPYSVVLFDEAEKAHPDVFNILLQVLDEGRLTDSQGRRIDFTNTIVIMTSNVGARQILDLTGTVEYEELQGEVMSILENHFKPEFLNRIDEKVVFAALDRDAIVQILEILIRGFNKILAEQDLSITFTDAAKEHLVEVGYQPEYGARPLKRALLTEVQDPLATCILNGEFAPGDAIVADRDGDRLSFAKG